MSLSIGANSAIYPGAGTPKQADATSRAGASAQSASSGEQSGQAGRSQITDQIDITSIIININQTTTAPNGNQLIAEVDPLITPLADGGSPLQPLGQGGSSSTTFEASIALQILNETAGTTAQTQNGAPATGNSPASSGASAHSAHRAVNISI